MSWAWWVVRLVWQVKKGGKKNSRGKGKVSLGRRVPAVVVFDGLLLLGVLESEGAGGVVDIIGFGFWGGGVS